MNLITKKIVNGVYATNKTAMTLLILILASCQSPQSAEEVTEQATIAPIEQTNEIDQQVDNKDYEALAVLTASLNGGTINFIENHFILNILSKPSASGYVGYEFLGWTDFIDIAINQQIVSDSDEAYTLLEEEHFSGDMYYAFRSQIDLLKQEYENLGFSVRVLDPENYFTDTNWSENNYTSTNTVWLDFDPTEHTDVDFVIIVDNSNLNFDKNYSTGETDSNGDVSDHAHWLTSFIVPTGFTGVITDNNNNEVIF